MDEMIDEEMDYEDDPISSAKTNAANEIDWEKEAMDYAGEDWFQLNQREKNEIISDIKRDWYRSHNLGEDTLEESLRGSCDRRGFLTRRIRCERRVANRNGTTPSHPFGLPTIRR
jgi:hypothetical protein